MRPKTAIRRIDRRSFLKTSAVVAGAVTINGTARVKQPPDPHDIHAGDSAEVTVDGEAVGAVTSFATTNPAGRLSSLGVHIDGGALAAFEAGGAHHDDAFEAHLHFPEETDEGDPIDTHQFTFNGFHYNPRGHPPQDIYTFPHFDFHFYFIDEDVVHGITDDSLPPELPFLGLADYEVPEEQHPPGYEFEELRLIVEEMGEHLLDGTAPEFNGEPFTHTNVYGVYDPSIVPGENNGCVELPLGPGGEDIKVPVYGSGSEGRLHFVEPMITTDFLQNDLDEEMAVDIATPEVFPVADDYPTEYVMTPDGDGGVYVSIDDFQEFPGPSD